MEYINPLTQFNNRVAKHPDQAYLHQPDEEKWTTYSWREVDQMARIIAVALKEQGFEQGDRIAILSKNCAQWVMADIAIAMAGMISVPIYYTAGADTISYVLEHSGSKALFLGKLDSYDALKKAEVTIPIIGFPYRGVPADHQWSHWLEQYQPLQIIPELDNSDVYTIVYTSGSTGQPKGVVLTGENLSAAASDALEFYPAGHHRVISYLPMAHITERSLVTMSSLYMSLEIFFNESLETFLRDLKHSQPTLFISVPRLWAKFQSQILSKIPEKRLQRLLSIPIVGSMVAAKLRKELGFGSCTGYGSGSAPISPGLLNWFATLGIEISEGWGMTEVSGAACSNTPFDKSKVGTIGQPFPNIQMKLSDEGELLVKGGSVFKEYYLRPELNAESFVDGWFKTGDKATQNADGSWSIVGRVKEQFKTAKGKYVAPVPLESLLGANALIEQVCVLGSGMPQPLALVVVSELDGIDDAAIEKELTQCVDDVNAQVEPHLRLAAIVITEQPWTIENGLLTPTLKLKRNEIEQHYASLIGDKYPNKVMWQKSM